MSEMRKEWQKELRAIAVRQRALDRQESRDALALERLVDGAIEARHRSGKRIDAENARLNRRVAILEGRLAS